MKVSKEQQKKNAASRALDYIEDNLILGVGTGSTVNYFIDELPRLKHRLEACVASSVASEKRLRAHGLTVIDLNTAGELSLYVDGADEVNSLHQMIKGGGGALTREKIVASVAKQFVCIVDESKWVEQLGAFPLALEVISMARSFVAREVVKLGGNPCYRLNTLTDNGHLLLDVTDLSFALPRQLEEALNAIPGVVENGVFAKRLADVVLVAHGDKVDVR